MFEVGRLCIKTAGREAGKYCVIVKKVDENFVMITGPKSLTRVKRRRCNINHLEPMAEKIDIKSDASDTDILKAYQEASIFVKLGMEKPKKAKEKPEAEALEKKEKHKKGEKRKPRETKPKKEKKSRPERKKKK